MFAEIAHDLAEQPTLMATLEQTVNLAVDSVPGCDFAGVSWLRRDQGIETPASTDPIVAECDAAQYELNEGPCVESAWEGELYVVDDMGMEQRWPKFAAKAAELGIGSMLACQLAAPQGVVGALNLYARDASSFDEESQGIAVVFAAHASLALANQRMENDLRRAYESRGIVGQAIGIMVERHRVTPGAAFEMLVRASQQRHVKLRELATYVVETGIDPDAVQAREGQIVD
jgi:transcriptional regulator with GAF, ATPase, and Fis domain